MAENVTTQKLSHWFIQKAKEEGGLLVPSRLMNLLCLACWLRLRLRLAESDSLLMNGNFSPQFGKIITQIGKKHLNA